MKICIVVDNLNESSGWGRLAKKLGSSLTKKGNNVGFVTRAGDHDSHQVLLINLRNLSVLKPVVFLLTLYKIRKFSKQFDKVFCFDINPYGILVSAALFGTRIPVVIYSLGSYSLLPKNLFRNILIRITYSCSYKIVVVSEFVRKQIKESGLNLKKASILPVGVDTDFFSPVQCRPREISKCYIVGVGAIKYRKGFHLSIEAFALIAEEFPELQYIIVGYLPEDKYGRGITNKVKELGLENRVLFLGTVSDEELRSLYTFATFFILTPITSPDAIEGFGMVYLEAASCGITAVGTKNTGAEAAIVDGETGIIVDPVPGTVAEAMRTLIINNNMRIRMAKAAKLRARVFSWDNIADDLMKILF